MLFCVERSQKKIKKCPVMCIHYPVLVTGLKAMGSAPSSQFSNSEPAY